MAVAYLNENATSLAAANWSDATGFADGATLVINEKQGGLNITGGLSQAAADIEYLDVLGYTGVLGNTGASATFDADGTAEASTTAVSRVRWWAPGTGYFAAGGANTLFHFFQQAGGNIFLTNGIVKHVHLQSGKMNANENITSTGTWKLYGGNLTADYHATNTLTTVNVFGGSHVVNKQFTTLNVYSGEITINTRLLTLATINLFGGRLNLVGSGAIATMNALAGILDLSRVGTPIAVGGTATTLGPNLQLIYNPLVTFSNVSKDGTGPKNLAA